MTALPPEDHRRLVAILGRLGSDVDAERAVAGKLACQLLDRHGLQWADVLASEPEGVRPEHQRQARLLLLLHPGRWDAWESRFLNSLLQLRGHPTERQADKLAELRERAQRWREAA